MTSLNIYYNSVFSISLSNPACKYHQCRLPVSKHRRLQVPGFWAETTEGLLNVVLFRHLVVLYKELELHLLNVGERVAVCGILPEGGK